MHAAAMNEINISKLKFDLDDLAPHFCRQLLENLIMMFSWLLISNTSSKHPISIAITVGLVK